MEQNAQKQLNIHSVHISLITDLNSQETRHSLKEEDPLIPMCTILTDLEAQGPMSKARVQHVNDTVLWS